MKKITTIEPVSVRPAAAKIRVAAYCRVSTEAEAQLVSLDAQKSHYEELISANPDWVFAGIYYDEGVSGTGKEKRPALMRMIADCEAGRLDRILTKSLSRFARNTTDCLELTRKLLGLGVTIFFEKENLDTGSMESELLLSIMSSLAESESVSISENNKWGIRHRYENGTYKIGCAPYGYSVKDGAMVINEDEAGWVRRIFASALEGSSCTAIAKQLNGLGVTTRKGGRWSDSTIRGMLTNEKYIGDCLFQKTFSDFRFRRHHNHGERDQFYVKDHHEAIVSREDFEAAGEILRQRAREKNPKKDTACFQNRYPFTGKIICGECGGSFKRHINSTGSLKYPVWVCKKHLKDADSCSMKYVRECDLEYAFTTMMNKLIFARREVLDALLDGIRGETHKENLRLIDGIDRKLEKNADRRQTLTAIMTRGYLKPALFTQESNELAAEADALTAEKDRLVKEISGSYHKTDALGDLIRFAGHAEPCESFDGTLVGRFLDHAEVISRNEVIFHLKCGLRLKERIGDI